MPAQDFRLAEDCPANPVAQHSKDAANGSPSPGGEGRDEGERPNHYYSYPIRDGISVATPRLALPESGAEATALQTLVRRPSIPEPREAFGLRRVHRRYCASISPDTTGNGQ
jgi:hypothetical protein